MPVKLDRDEATEEEGASAARSREVITRAGYSTCRGLSTT